MDPFSFLHLDTRQLMEAFVLYSFLSSAVSALPAPHKDSSLWYEWFYKFSNGVVGSLKQINMRGLDKPEVVSPPAEVAKS